MTEELISFETAKSAKEKGFNEDCHYYYLTSNQYEKPFLVTPNVKRNISTNNNRLDHFKDSPDEICYSVSTQSLLQRWLREKHNIFISIIVDQTTAPKFYYKIIYFFGNPQDLTEKEWGWKDLGHGGLYRTYEQALEEGLQETLKLL